MAGIIQTGKEHLSGAIQGGNRVVSMEQQRNTANEQLKAAEKQQKASLSATGAGVGAGLAVMGGLGATGIGLAAAAGIGVGYLLSEVF